MNNPPKTDTQAMRKVYSYIRFSSLKQREGNSLDRQMQYAATWAAEHGMSLDATLTMRDEGLSAYSQKHIKTGAFGSFMRSIENGHVLPGSVLIVESLDRLSRADILDALPQLISIVNAGVKIITVADGKEYSAESIRANPWDLFGSMLIMQRAHEESQTKSRRIKSAFEDRAKGWQNGTYRGKVPGGLDPAWVHWSKTAQKYELVEPEAAAVRQIVRMWLDGYSGYAIREALRTESTGCKYMSDAAGIPEMLYERHHLFIGTRVVTYSGTEYRLENYYPAIIDRDTYNALVSSFQTRPRQSGRVSDMPCILTGSGLFNCGYCGSLMGMHRSAAGKPPRLECKGRACATKSVAMLPIEKSLIAFCSDQMNLNSLTGRDQTSEVKNRLSAARVQIQTLNRQLSRLMDAMLATDAPPAAFATKAREIENQIAHLKHTIRTDEALLLTAAAKPSGHAAEQWRALAAATLAHDLDARMKVRRLVAETFSQIVFYRYSPTPPTALQKWQREKSWDLLLVSRSGVSRQIRISRDGELLALRDESRAAAAA